MSGKQIEGQDEIQTETAKAVEADTGRYRHINQLGITPGEWRLKPSGNGVDRNIVSDESVMPIAQYILPVNAKLMSAAPDMYEVLYYIYLQGKRIDTGLAVRIRSALEKAAGKIID